MESPHHCLRVTPEKFIEMNMMSGVPFTLKLENVIDKPVAFKIKTTAPKSYLVRPSTGVIPEGEIREVQIIHQQHQHTAGDSSTERSSDRFLIQSIPVEPAMMSLTSEKDFWNNCQKNQKGDMRDHRLAVVFHDAEGVNLTRTAAGPSTAAAAASAASVASMERANASRLVGPTAGSAGGLCSQEKYQELVNYTVSLEHSKKQLTLSLDQAEKRLAELGSMSSQERQAAQTAGSATPGAATGPDSYKAGGLCAQWKLWQVVLVAIVGLLVGRMSIHCGPQ